MRTLTTLFLAATLLSVSLLVSARPGNSATWRAGDTAFALRPEHAESTVGLEELSNRFGIKRQTSLPDRYSLIVARAPEEIHRVWFHPDGDTLYGLTERGGSYVDNSKVGRIVLLDSRTLEVIARSKERFRGINSDADVSLFLAVGKETLYADVDAARFVSESILRQALGWPYRTTSHRYSFNPKTLRRQPTSTLPQERPAQSISLYSINSSRPDSFRISRGPQREWQYGWETLSLPGDRDRVSSFVRREPVLAGELWGRFFNEKDERFIAQFIEILQQELKTLAPPAWKRHPRFFAQAFEERFKVPLIEVWNRLLRKGYSAKGLLQHFDPTAMKSLAQLPRPAGVPDASTDTLPRPAGGAATLDTATLPRPAEAEGPSSDTGLEERTIEVNRRGFLQGTLGILARLALRGRGASEEQLNSIPEDAKANFIRAVNAFQKVAVAIAGSHELDRENGKEDEVADSDASYYWLYPWERVEQWGVRKAVSALIAFRQSTQQIVEKPEVRALADVLSSMTESYEAAARGYPEAAKETLQYGPTHDRPELGQQMMALLPLASEAPEQFLIRYDVWVLRESFRRAGFPVGDLEEISREAVSAILEKGWTDYVEQKAQEQIGPKVRQLMEAESVRHQFGRLGATFLVSPEKVAKKIRERFRDPRVADIALGECVAEAVKEAKKARWKAINEEMEAVLAQRGIPFDWIAHHVYGPSYESFLADPEGYRDRLHTVMFQSHLLKKARVRASRPKSRFTRERLDRIERKIWNASREQLESWIAHPPDLLDRRSGAKVALRKRSSKQLADRLPVQDNVVELPIPALREVTIPGEPQRAFKPPPGVENFLLVPWIGQTSEELPVGFTIFAPEGWLGELGRLFPSFQIRPLSDMRPDSIGVALLDLDGEIPAIHIPEQHPAILQLRLEELPNLASPLLGFIATHSVFRNRILIWTADSAKPVTWEGREYLLFWESA